MGIMPPIAEAYGFLQGSDTNIEREEEGHTARAHDATLWTQNEPFKDLAGVKYIEKK